MGVPNIVRRACASRVCRKQVPQTADQRQIYCSEKCNKAEIRARRKDRELQRQIEERDAPPTGDTATDATKAAVDASIRQLRTPELDAFIQEGWGARMISDPTVWSITTVALATGLAKGQVHKLQQAYLEEQSRKAKAVAFQVSDEAKANLSDFVGFRGANFRVPSVGGHILGGVAYATPEFQQRWSRAIDDILANPGILLILAPPRHGKSEMLTHKLCQIIVRNPNVRAMWVGGNEDIAQQSVEQVRDELANNDRLRNAYLPAGTTFQPRGRVSGALWKSGKFTVATRNVTGVKSPTLLALGKGGKILSRDADIIVVDDFVDHDSTTTQGRRENDLRWFRTQLMSRREPHTSVIIIGSRQHYQDIYAHLIADETANIRVIVDSAHDEVACRGKIDHPPSEPGVESRCLLFPELRSHEWLMQQEQFLGRELFEMVYLNRPRSEGASLFSEEAVKAARNFARDLGTTSLALPQTVRLAGGLDPATKGYQAAFCWGLDPGTERQFMVDLDNTRGAGIAGFLDIAKRWLAAYGLRYWTIEANAAQHAYLQDREIREWATAEGVTIRSHHTGQNKWDPNLGVSSLARLFGRGLIDLPYATQDAQRKTDLYINQLLAFEAGPLQRSLSDLVMASWFPQPTLRSWRMDHLATAAQERDPEFPWADTQLVQAYGEP